MCNLCEFPQRNLWTFQKHPEFVAVQQDGWAVIAKCPACAQLWCEVAYEPYASFSFWAAWPGHVTDWQRVLAQDEGLPYYEWHEAVIVEQFPHLSSDERNAIEAWRKRSYGRTPIDERTPRFCSSSGDIQKFIAV